MNVAATSCSARRTSSQAAKRAPTPTLAASHVSLCVACALYWCPSRIHSMRSSKDVVTDGARSRRVRGASSQPVKAGNGPGALLISVLALPAVRFALVAVAPSFDSFLEGSS